MAHDDIQNGFIYQRKMSLTRSESLVLALVTAHYSTVQDRHQFTVIEEDISFRRGIAIVQLRSRWFHFSLAYVFQNVRESETYRNEELCALTACTGSIGRRNSGSHMSSSTLKSSSKSKFPSESRRRSAPMIVVYRFVKISSRVHGVEATRRSGAISLSCFSKGIFDVYTDLLMLVVVMRLRPLF